MRQINNGLYERSEIPIRDRPFQPHHSALGRIFETFGNARKVVDAGLRRHNDGKASAVRSYIGMALVSLAVSSPAFGQYSGQMLSNLTINSGTLNGTVASTAVVTAGATTQPLSSWMTSFVPVGGSAADLGAAVGPILGMWPNLYFAPSPVFSGMPSVSGASTAQMQFTRGGSLFTFVGASPTSVGISSSENLPMVFANNGYQTRLYIDPVYGNVGIGTVTPGARLDVAAQSILIEQPFTPASSSTPCTTGTMAWDGNYVYVCVSANTWKRAALGAF